MSETHLSGASSRSRPSLGNVYLVTGAASVFPVLYALLGKDPSPGVALFGFLAPIVAIALWFQRYLRRSPIARTYDAGLFFYFGWPVLIPFYAVRLEGRRGWRLAAFLIALIFAPQVLAVLVLALRGS